MIMTYRIFFRLGLVLILFLLSGAFSHSEAQAGLRKSEIIGLLEDSLVRVKFSADSSRRAMATVLNQRDVLKEENRKLRDENRQLVFKLQDADSKARYLEQTNSMFVLYTGIAAVVFLFTLLFIVVRKLTNRSKVTKAPEPDRDVDRRFERLNALGNLRERGLLTDQEVEEQKRILMGGNQ
jgi:hypothetical protein